MFLSLPRITSIEGPTSSVEMSTSSKSCAANAEGRVMSSPTVGVVHFMPGLISR